MKTVFFVAILFFVILVKGQKLSSFYIEPGISWKRHAPEKASAYNLNSASSDLNLPYLQVKMLKYIYPSQFFVSSAAVNVGYRFKNSDKIQLGIMYDDCIEGFGFNYTESHPMGPNYNFIAESYGLYYSGVLFTNISLLYKRSVILFKSRIFNYDRFIRVHLVLGVNYCRKPNNGLELMDNYYRQFTAPDSSVYTLSAETYVVPTNFIGALKLNGGLDITFGKGEREWFTLNINVSYASQNRYQSFTYLKVEVSKNNNTSLYQRSYRGTANGVYVSLTRRFFLKKPQRKHLQTPEN